MVAVSPNKLFQRYEANPILTPQMWPYNANAVFNPGAQEVDGETLLLVRAEDFQDFFHLTVAKSKDGKTDWKVEPQFSLMPDPAYNEEQGGVEHPRIVGLEEIRSGDSHGRAFCALGYTTSCSLPSPILGLSIRLFQQTIRSCLSISSPRSWAFPILGAVSYLQRFPGDTEVKNIAVQLAQRLYALCEVNSSEDWPWGEDLFSDENSRLPQALVAAGNQFDDKGLLNQGSKSREWLIDLQTEPSDGHFTLIGNQGWLERGKGKSLFDQQPVDATASGCHSSGGCLLAGSSGYW